MTSKLKFVKSYDNFEVMKYLLSSLSPLYKDSVKPPQSHLHSCTYKHHQYDDSLLLLQYPQPFQLHLSWTAKFYSKRELHDIYIMT